MNITTNYLETLLEAVTREQYKSVMKDIKDNSKVSYSPKQVKNVRNSETYKQIFGNKQRLWFKININLKENLNQSIKDDIYYSFHTKEAIDYYRLIRNYYYSLIQLSRCIIIINKL